LSTATNRSDRKLLLIVSGVILVLILVVVVFAPDADTDDPHPTTTNNGPQGARAAYLTLEQMGRTVSRWKRPLSDLNAEMDDAQAARTTLVLAAPEVDLTELKTPREELKKFMERGGRVLATGPSGAALLPGGKFQPAGLLKQPLCHTTPEGPGALAQAGVVEIMVRSQWPDESAKVEVEQRCGNAAVVVRYAVGKGEAVWWSSAWPMENAQLKNESSLRLLLASAGNGRDVVFDESLRGAVKDIWDNAKGLPLHWLEAQVALLFLLLVVSFSRRRGPLRAPVMLPRSSPVEFAESMGDLYEKAGATSVATEAARRWLLRVLVREAGISQQSVQQGPEAISEALQARLGGDWSQVRDHLMRCQEIHRERTTQRSALALVRALREDAQTVQAKLKPPAVMVIEATPAHSVG
jgi:hypothetical protein